MRLLVVARLSLPAFIDARWISRSGHGGGGRHRRGRIGTHERCRRRTVVRREDRSPISRLAWLPGLRQSGRRARRTQQI